MSAFIARSLRGRAWRACGLSSSLRFGVRPLRVVPTMRLERTPNRPRIGKPSATTSAIAQAPRPSVWLPHQWILSLKAACEGQVFRESCRLYSGVQAVARMPLSIIFSNLPYVVCSTMGVTKCLPHLMRTSVGDPNRCLLPSPRGKSVWAQVCGVGPVVEIVVLLPRSPAPPSRAAFHGVCPVWKA